MPQRTIPRTQSGPRSRPPQAVNDPFAILPDLKGSFAEEVVRLGFKQLGLEVHRVGVEHSKFMPLYQCPTAYQEAMFWQIRRSPDFLMVDAATQSFHFVEVKYRKNYRMDWFQRDLVRIYLGGSTNSLTEALGRSARPGSAYFGLNKNIHILLLTPEKARIARLGEMLSSDSSGSGVHATWNESKWNDLNDPAFRTKWGQFERFYDSIKSVLTFPDD